MEKHASKIIEHVNLAFCQRKDWQTLIGPNPVEVLYSNHENHAGYIRSQLLIKGAGRFFETILWVYRSYMNRGFMPDYFLAVFPLWQQAISEHISETHASQVNAIYDFFLLYHQDFLKLAKVLSQDIEVEPGLKIFYEKYLNAMLAPDMMMAMQISREFIKSANDITLFWEQVIQPAMYDVGRLWSEGEITVGQEHIATSITQRVMALHYPLILEQIKHDKTILVASSPGELHEIGPRILADILELHGWNTVYTGADTPRESLVDLALTTKADYLCVSTTLPFNLPGVKKLIEEVKIKVPQTKILVGGQAYQGEENLWQEMGADGFAPSASGAVAMLQ